MPTLKATHLGKQFGQRQVVKSVSLEINSGEIVGLLGPNGAGKTTCFYMIVGLIPPEQGQVFLDKTNLTNMAMHQRAREGIGYLPQEASIFRKLSVHDNIMGVLELRKDLNKQQRQHHCDRLMDEFNLQTVRNSLGVSLSGGERRRVEIARALAMEPKFILLDEPFAGIDPISIYDIKAIIKSLQARDIGILITDHNVRETLNICTRAYILAEGKAIAQGNSQEILTNKLVRQIYLGEEFTI